MKNSQTTQTKENVESVMIQCPKCGAPFEVTEALRESIAEKTREELRSEMSKDIAKEIEKERIKAASEAKKQTQEEFRIELKDKDEQIKEKDEALKIAREAELKARKREREADDKIKNSDLELEKKLAKEKNLLEADISKRFSEEQSLKEREHQKKIDDLVKQLNDAKLRAEQGSQQMQGEILELDLEESLKHAFPQDVIEPVEKGVKGADVRHKICSTSGKIVGVILWESKRTKNWQDGWIVKLKTDLRAEGANVPVIVSSALPDDAAGGFGQKDGVWICKPVLAIALAITLRNHVLEIAIAHAQSKNRGTLADSLYDYVTSHEFRQHVESMVETYREMKEQISKERIAYERSWKSRESQVDRMLTGTAQIVGSIQGRLGNSAFGPVKGLELLENGYNQNKGIKE